MRAELQQPFPTLHLRVAARCTTALSRHERDLFREKMIFKCKLRSGVANKKRSRRVWTRGPFPLFALTLIFSAIVSSAHANRGATVPWTTYEAEAMTINGGTILGPPPRAVDKNVTVTNTVESESSG